MTKVLIVEDDSNMTLLLMQIFNNELKGDVVFTLTDSFKTATKALNDDTHDVIILDGKLEDSHGREVLASMNTEEKNKTIVHSGEIGFVSEAAKEGVSVCNKGDYESIVGLIKRKLNLT